VNEMNENPYATMAVQAHCKVCNARIQVFIVERKKYDTWKLIQGKKSLFCRHCRRNDKPRLKPEF
jgi:hypothetical protein